MEEMMTFEITGVYETTKEITPSLLMELSHWLSFWEFSLPVLRCLACIFVQLPRLRRLNVVLYTPAREYQLLDVWLIRLHVLRKKKRSKSLVFCTICIFAVDSILKLILKKIPVCVMWLHIFSNNHCVPLATIQTALFGSQTYQFSLIVLWIDFVLPKSILLMFVYRIVVCVMMIKTWFYYFYTFTEYFAFDLLAVTYVPI